MRRLAPLGAALLCVSLGAAALSQAQDEPEKPRKKKPKPDGPKEPEISKDEEANLAPEARLCVKIARGDVIRGLAVEPYIDLLSDGNVPDWNGRRKQDGGKLLDLAGRTWDPKGRDDLELKLEGLDLQGADLSNVLFAPKTSFRFSDLTGASFRGSCLEGVEFASVWAFANGARSAKTVKSTSVADADFRDCVWFWCTALDRTVQRTFEEARSDDPQAKARRLAERQRQLMALQRLVNGWGGEPPVFAFVDLDGVKKDKENSLGPLDPVDEQQVPPQMRSSRTLEKLIKAARAGTIERAINKLADHRHIARQRECTNPLRFEPALAEAIAACDSRLARVATWKAVKLSDMAGRDPNEEAIVVGGPDIVFVVDDERSVSAARLLVSQGPIIAWCKGVLPTTFCSSAIVLKDQSYTTGVLHGHPVFALAETLHGERARVAPSMGTFHSEVVVDVTGVENLSEADSAKRALLDAKLKDYAQSLGDDMQYQPVYDPVKGSDGKDPEKALPEDIRDAIRKQVGKDAFAGMRCFKLAGQKFAQNEYYHVLSNDPKAILVVESSFVSRGSIYSEGPIVFLGKNQKVWIQRCVTKSWLLVKGQPQVGQFTCVGTRVDLEEKEPEPPPEKEDGKEKDEK